MTKRGVKQLSRLRSGGVVTSKTRLSKTAPPEAILQGALAKKLRMGGLPNRRALATKRR